MKLSKRQLTAMTWWNRPGMQAYDAIICDGAIRSGKTMSMVCGFFLWSMSCFDGQTFGLCGKTVSSLRRNIIQQLPGWLGTSFQLREYAGQGKLVVSDCTGRQNTYYLFGGEDESSYQYIQGITLAGVLLDEVALMPRSFVEQACARCSVEGSRLWFNCNPAGPEHWFYREWICRRQRKNALYLHFTMEDNPGLSRAVRERYESMYDGVFYERYVLGRWTASEGLIYSFDPEKHVTDKLPRDGRYFISVDYGTANPFSAGLWCVSGGVAVRMREFYHSGRDFGVQLTDEQYYERLEKLAGDFPVEKVIVDPSAASLIATIRHHGRFRVRKARNEVMAGIRQVAELLRTGRLLISKDCRDTIREFGLYRWADSGSRDQPRKEQDHAMDDIRYFCATVLARLLPNTSDDGKERE